MPSGRHLARVCRGRALRCSPLLLAATCAAPLRAQQQPQPMGTVLFSDAEVSGGLTIRNNVTTLLSNASVTANDRTAPITLARGGEALVCATSQFHLLHSGTGNSLLFGLDRGAMQIASPAQPQDIILTPDIRFTVEAPGTFDLRLRVTRDGDTCVDNRGPHAPVLLLFNSFSDATYRLLPGQHVLFEHGDLHQVVDNERSPCGCPAPAPPPRQVAAAGASTSLTPAQQAASEHPFPEAASQGLSPAPETPPPMPTAGDVRSSTEFHINAGDAAPVALTTTAPGAVASSPTPASSTGQAAQESPAGNAAGPAAPPSAPPGAHDIAHSIGHFFHRLFHPHAGGNKPAAPAQ